MPISALIDSVLRFWLVVCMSVLMWEGRSFHEFHTIYVLHRQPLVLKAFTCWLHVPWGMPITLSLYRYTWYFLTTQTLCVGFVCVSSHLVLGKVSCAGAVVKHMQTISNLICCTSLFRSKYLAACLHTRSGQDFWLTEQGVWLWLATLPWAAILGQARMRSHCRDCAFSNHFVALTCHVHKTGLCQILSRRAIPIESDHVGFIQIRFRFEIYSAFRVSDLPSSPVSWSSRRGEWCSCWRQSLGAKRTFLKAEMSCQEFLTVNW